MPRLILVLTLAAIGCGGDVPDPVNAVQPKTEILGRLDTSLIDEASGVAISRKFPDRLYLHNDSGGGPYFYLSTYSGDQAQRVEIAGYDDAGQDLEDIAIGKCAIGPNDCIFLGNIGDNFLRRDSIEILVIEEQERFETSVRPIRRIRLVYPDGAHNAEGLAVDPNGNLYILTKGLSSVTPIQMPSRIYRLGRDRLWDESDEPRTLELVGEIDLPALAKQHADEMAAVATALDICPDGRHYLILTRRQAYEFSRDLSEHRMFSIPYLFGQEAIACLPDGSGFIYTQEFKASQEANIIRVDIR